jgi:hypothetical protein
MRELELLAQACHLLAHQIYDLSGAQSLSVTGGCGLRGCGSGGDIPAGLLMQNGFKVRSSWLRGMCSSCSWSLRTISEEGFSVALNVHGDDDLRLAAHEFM